VGIPKVESVVDDLGNSLGGKLDLNPDPIKANYGVGAKEGTKLLNQFNSVESLIQATDKLSPVKAGLQGFVKGDGAKHI